MRRKGRLIGKKDSIYGRRQ